MDYKMIDTITTLHSDTNSNDSKDTTTLPQQIRLLTDSIDEVQEKI